MSVHPLSFHLKESALFSREKMLFFLRQSLCAACRLSGALQASPPISRLWRHCLHQFASGAECAGRVVGFAPS